MINQMELIGVIFTELDRQGVKSPCSRQMNTIIKSVDAIIDECLREPVMAFEGMGLKAWLASDDVGMSSKYMASVLGGFACQYAHPHDLDDFGRCSRLLVAVPEFRDRIDEMRDKSQTWSRLVDVWESVEILNREGKLKEANRVVMDAVLV
jgi:hypothetical protein